MLYVGIDNGLNGGIAVINRAQSVIGKWVMPVIKSKKTEYDVNRIVEILKEIKNRKNTFVMLEKAHVRPISGKRACFMNGFGYGIMQGILSSLNMSYEIVDPKVWQKNLFEGVTSDTKTASINFCKKKFPNIDLKATERTTKDHDGIADAICMAVYCYRKNR